MLQCIGSPDAPVSAQTIENKPDIMRDENVDLSLSDLNIQLASLGSSILPAPKVISETVEPVVESWGSAKGLGGKMDWIHAYLYKTMQDRVDRLDRWFKPPKGEQPIVAAPSRFRIGMFGETKINEGTGLDVRQVLDFDTDIELPNMKRRIKLIITTSDPTTLPGRYVTEQLDKSLRAAVVKQWMPDVSTSIGVRMRWKPELFANAVWSPSVRNTGNWLLYPHQKFYWENESGVGEISTLIFDHWTDRWNTRFSTSIKWSDKDRKDDLRTGRKDEGFRWSEVYIFGHIQELLDETQVGRVVSGDDMARAWGIRLAAFGGVHVVDEYRAGVFYRCPLRKKWMYLLVEPEINWSNANNWNHEWTVKCGIEMLFWGKKER